MHAIGSMFNAIMAIGAVALLVVCIGAAVGLLLWLAFGKDHGDEYTNKF